jgi:hypothetical protein
MKKKICHFFSEATPADTFASCQIGTNCSYKIEYVPLDIYLSITYLSIYISIYLPTYLSTYARESLKMLIFEEK